MRNFILIVILSFSGSSFTIPGQFNQDIFDAIHILNQEHETIDRLSGQYGCNTLEVISIVFPEIIRYSRFKDFFETKALEQLYVQNGSSSADFSIGFFQMKPSFVEDLEYHVQQLPGLKTDFQEVVNYQVTSEEGRRFERIERLKSFEWQLKYAFCYYNIMQKCFEGFQFENDEARLRFFASAYNFGFTRSFEEIEAWMNEKAFPYGKKFQTEQFAFCELSAAFYKELHIHFDKTP